MISILLVEDNAAECDGLCAAAESNEDAAITAVTGSAVEARRLVGENSFDAVIVDLELSEGDGASFIVELPSLCTKQVPFVLVTTRTTSETVLNAVRERGAYIISKQNRLYCPRYVLQLVTLLVPYKRARGAFTGMPPAAPPVSPQEERRRHVIDAMGELIQSFGGRQNVEGYNYLIDTSMAILQYEHGVPSLSKEIYPAIQKQYNKSPKSIERCMRYIIHTMWLDSASQMRRLGVPYNAKTERCSIKEFCTFMANHFRRDYTG